MTRSTIYHGMAFRDLIESHPVLLVADSVVTDERPVEVLITQEAYAALTEKIKGVNDDHIVETFSELVQRMTSP